MTFLKKHLHTIIILSIFFLGLLFHTLFLSINEVLKVADSFAYLQMSQYFRDFSPEAFGTGWFGFFYSYFLFFQTWYFWWEGPDRVFYLAQLSNIFLFFLSGYLLYLISSKYLDKIFVYLTIILFFLSSWLLHFNINVLSENIYIPLFLGFVYFLLNFLEKPNYIKIIGISLFLVFLYFTRWEAFIYIFSVILIFFYLIFFRTDIELSKALWYGKKYNFWKIFWDIIKSYFTKKNLIKVNSKKLFRYSSVLLVAFAVFIFPYLAYLNSFTWEWWLTNKWSSNLRQADMRSMKEMDNDGFERAVAELTGDKHHLIAGFAGGLQYDTPSTDKSLKSLIIENPWETFSRWLYNQKKLYLEMIPRMIVWHSYEWFFLDDSFIQKNKILRWWFLWLCLSIVMMFLYWFLRLILDRKYDFIVIYFSFFIIASIFFTIFFVLNRYFIIFLPFAYLLISYWLQDIYNRLKENKNKIIFLSTSVSILILIFSFSVFQYFLENKSKDEEFLIKKEAGEWLRQNYTDDYGELKIMERWPITTYYAGARERWLVPYTHELSDILEYAKYNDLDILVVDSLDFKKYRPSLIFLLDEQFIFPGLERIKVIKRDNQKIILYKIIK